MSRIIALLSALAIVATTVAVSPGTAQASGNTAVANIDNFNRAQVAATYRSAIEANLALNPQWNGSVDACQAGSAASSFDAGTVEAINWFRRMAGLNNVVEDPGQSTDAQRAALMMQAENALSHSPARSWDCYSAAGAEAAGLSNLTLGASGTLGVLGQIEDPGSANVALGHRRWLLFPELETVGVGNTSRAGTVQVINDFGARNAESPWVAWPPAGFVPDEVVFDRWSLSYAGSGSVDFSQARVSVTENGRSMQVRMLPVINGFGDPALGFEVPGANPEAAGDTVYRVQVTNMIIGGRSVDRTYTVTAFDVDGPQHTCQGLAATIVGTAGNDTIRGTSGRDVIVGLGGNDRIEGLAGHDVICGGPGADTILGGWGNDRLSGGNGADTIRGGNGADILRGGNGQDTLAGQQGGDHLIGGAHGDALTGGLGMDTCWGQASQQASLASDRRTCERGR